MKTCLIVLLLISFSTIYIKAQKNFCAEQLKLSSKLINIFPKQTDTLKKQFEKKGLIWPAKQMFIRSFKLERQLEIWVRNSDDEAFKLFKTYRVCMQSGTLGPKRLEGDYQVPEGFYTINEFRHNSQYHLALGISYPNFSDKQFCDPNNPGGDIYIHGNCVSTGCLPLSDPVMEEVYVLASHCRQEGQDFIPIHIFPVNFNNSNSLSKLSAAIASNPNLDKFYKPLRKSFEYFQMHKKLPILLTNSKGEYIVLPKEF